MPSTERVLYTFPVTDALNASSASRGLLPVLPQGTAEGLSSRAARDTFPVGCAYDKSIVYHRFFENNPDKHNAKYNTELGVYTKNCGLKNVDMSWGHDEYMYQHAGRNVCIPHVLYTYTTFSFSKCGGPRASTPSEQPLSLSIPPSTPLNTPVNPSQHPHQPLSTPPSTPLNTP
eukprot:1190027-Prorocentrum_minimum.AAC.2